MTPEPEYTLNAPKLPEDAWIRTCQECGNKQTDREPIDGMSEAYRMRKCKKCKSEALDYGTHNKSYND